jgi:hypothetical protein
MYGYRWMPFWLMQCTCYFPKMYDCYICWFCGKGYVSLHGQFLCLRNFI